MGIVQEFGACLSSECPGPDVPNVESSISGEEDNMTHGLSIVFAGLQCDRETASFPFQAFSKWNQKVECVVDCFWPIKKWREKLLAMRFLVIESRNSEVNFRGQGITRFNIKDIYISLLLKTLVDLTSSLNIYFTITTPRNTMSRCLHCFRVIHASCTKRQPFQRQ